MVTLSNCGLVELCSVLQRCRNLLYSLLLSVKWEARLVTAVGRV